MVVFDNLLREVVFPDRLFRRLRRLCSQLLWIEDFRRRVVQNGNITRVSVDEFSEPVKVNGLLTKGKIDQRIRRNDTYVYLDET